MTEEAKANATMLRFPFIHVYSPTAAMATVTAAKQWNCAAPADGAAKETPEVQKSMRAELLMGKSDAETATDLNGQGAGSGLRGSGGGGSVAAAKRAAQQRKSPSREAMSRER